MRARGADPREFPESVAIGSASWALARFQRRRERTATAEEFGVSSSAISWRQAQTVAWMYNFASSIASSRK